MTHYNFLLLFFFFGLIKVTHHAFKYEHTMFFLNSSMFEMSVMCKFFHFWTKENCTLKYIITESDKFALK